MQALGGLGGKTGVGGPGLSVAQRTALGLGMVLLPWVPTPGSCLAHMG
ncbi:hypothetical protein HaLaN_26336, partial [Haematococcus lacustris]